EAWGTMNSVGSVFTFRTSEAYLILAEASAYNGDEAASRATLEKFLASRMSGSVSVDKSGNDLIDFIRDERAREFLVEGHRWFDLRRYTVCQPYPWSKTIDHGYYYITEKNYDYVIDRIDWYRLEKNDGAYTLPLPREIRNFQTSLGNSVRPSRAPYLSTRPESDDDDDYDDDDW
ncbi:MAG: RagB/SusD family nutrient uptake outer membrane protein, partial [Duncaniella dubosii]|nr:RagB/SusD family nutrient uptake outer membrane protein [Duncaniella dubosii]